MLSAPPREPANAERSQTCVQSLPQSKTTKFVTFDQHYSVLLCTPDPGNHHFTLHLQSFHFIRRGIHSANLAQDIVIIVNNIVLYTSMVLDLKWSLNKKGITVQHKKDIS